MKLSLPNSVASRQDFKTVISDVRKFSAWAGQTAIKTKVSGAGAGQQPMISQAAADLINQWRLDKEAGKKGLDALIKELEELAAVTPHVTITLAAPAPAKLRQEIVAWFRKNVAPNMRVDFKFNATMLGGIVVHYGSRVFDWSFKRQILGARAKFPEILRNV